MAYRLRTRIAPTPSGYLHLGNAWSFALTWLAARSQGGFVHLRVDDLDADRFRGEYLQDLFASLRWLGLDWDGGPRDAAEFAASHSQRFRLGRYRDALEALRSRGGVYACSCSREQIRRHPGMGNLPGRYSGACREKGLSAEDGRSLRFRLGPGPVRARNERGSFFDLHPDRDMGDFVVRLKSGDPSYQLASVLDDVDLRVNFVVRGLDLIPSTGAQLSLSVGLGAGEFRNARFWHHSLVLDDAGGKLSKSAGSESLKALRERFPDPAPLWRFFARRMGLDPAEVRIPGDLLEGFRMEKVSTMPLRLSDFWRESAE